MPDKGAYLMMEQKRLDKRNNQAARNDGSGFIETMKPFATFGVKAMAFLGSALVHIVKNIPKPDQHGRKDNGDKVIKI